MKYSLRTYQPTDAQNVVKMLNTNLQNPRAVVDGAGNIRLIRYVPFSSSKVVVEDEQKNIVGYAYGLNNPSRYTDPTGHIPVDCYGTDYCGASNSDLLPDLPNPQNKPGSGFSDENIEDIFNTATDGDIITYTINNQDQLAVFALDPNGDLVLYDVASKSIIDLYSIANYGTGFYTYDVAKGKYVSNPAIIPLAVDQSDISLSNPYSMYDGSYYLGDYNLSIEFNYYYNYQSPDFIAGNVWLAVSSFLALTAVTGGTDLIPIVATAFVDVSLTLIFGADINPNNPMDVHVTPVPSMPSPPSWITDPSGYFFP